MTLRLNPHPIDPKLWASYVDVLDQTIRPGDYVAYASISGKSPQMVIAQVIQINRLNSSGEPIYENSYNKQGAGCTIKLQPLIDARGFWRSGQKHDYTTGTVEQVEKARAVTIQIPANVIKISWSPTETGE